MMVPNFVFLFNLKNWESNTKPNFILNPPVGVKQSSKQDEKKKIYFGKIFSPTPRPETFFNFRD